MFASSYQKQLNKHPQQRVCKTMIPEKAAQTGRLSSKRYNFKVTTALIIRITIHSDDLKLSHNV